MAAVNTYARIGLLLAVPVAINAVVWAALVQPLRARARAADDARQVRELIPQLEAALAESRPLVSEARRANASGGNNHAFAMQTVRKLADAHRVRLGALASQGGAAAPLSVELTGGFNALARWLSDVERQPGLQIEEWTITAGAPDQPHQLHLSLSAT